MYTNRSLYLKHARLNVTATLLIIGTLKVYALNMVIIQKARKTVTFTTRRINFQAINAALNAAGVRRPIRAINSPTYEIEFSDQATEIVNVSEFIETHRHCLEESVKNEPVRFRFKDLCAIFLHFNLDTEEQYIRETITMYSFKIYGFPECLSRDLFLSVYFFIEEVFGIHAELELCVRYDEDEEYPNVVGVVLGNHNVLCQIMSKADDLLEGSGIVIQYNRDMDWILDGFHLYKNILTRL